MDDECTKVARDVLRGIVGDVPTSAEVDAMASAIRAADLRGYQRGLAERDGEASDARQSEREVYASYRLIAEREERHLAELEAARAVVEKSREVVRQQLGDNLKVWTEERRGLVYDGVTRAALATADALATYDSAAKAGKAVE